MARPKKNNVDYFPHQCVSGKTIFILEQKHGNDGYAFWFKLLEILGTKPGHIIDLNKIEEMEFLQAKTRVNEVSTVEILTTLANLQAIDQHLWAQKIVWCQNFVDGISDVYVNRRVEIPAKPSFYSPKPRDAVVSTSNSTQSKVDQSKREERKVDEKKEKVSEPAPPNGQSKGFLVNEMHKLWLDSFPSYTANSELDYPALKSISDFIFKTAGVKNGYGNSDEEIKILNTFQLIADQVNREPFWVNKSLSTISKHVQEFYNKIKNPLNGTDSKHTGNGKKLDDNKLKEALHKRAGEWQQNGNSQ